MTHDSCQFTSSFSSELSFGTDFTMCWKKNPTNLQFVWIISDCLHVNLAQLWRTDEALSILPGLLYTYHLIHLAPVSLLQSGFWFGWFCVDSHKEDSNMSFQAYLLSALWKKSRQSNWSNGFQAVYQWFCIFGLFWTYCKFMIQE